MWLNWEGSSNVRDLGGVPLRAGGYTRFGSIVRSDHPNLLTPVGWEAVHQYGIQTILSLETAGLDSQAALRANRPVRTPEGSGIAVTARPIEDASDKDFEQKWIQTGLWGTPLYFIDALERWPELHGSALLAISHAPGPVLMHCGRGHDRTGIMTLILLAMAGATVDGITDDYLISTRHLAKREPGTESKPHEALDRAGTTAHDSIGAAVEIIDDDWLTRAGVNFDARRILRTLLRPKV